MNNFLILFFFLFNEIYSIPGTEDEGFAPGEENIEIDLNNVCPCDKTEGVCDFGCCCDEDCLNFMLDQNYYSLFSECDSSSSFKMTKDSKLDYCDGHKKSVDDLYNPLTLAFKILKKGFCLVKKQNYNNDPGNPFIPSENNVDNNLDDKIFGKNDNKNSPNFNPNVNDFEKMNFNVPITLPSGICLFGYYQIMKLQDYEVTCSYNINSQRQIIEYYNDQDHLYNLNISNVFYYIYIDEIVEDKILNKIEIIYFDNSSYTINHYYVDNDHNNYQDLTFIVRFLKDETDYPKSGNPGYIKGNPILIRKKEGNLENYSIYTILPIEKNNNCNDLNIGGFLYFDNYFDNKLTFEDFIIYGYRNTRCFKNIYDNRINNYRQETKFGKFGSANIRYNKDWKEINYRNELSGNNDFNINLFYGSYKSVGTVNNTQLEIYEMDLYEQTINYENIFYFISKFEKLKIETEWWYANYPGFIKLPQNMMYPFRIGTTTYSQKY